MALFETDQLQASTRSYGPLEYVSVMSHEQVEFCNVAPVGLRGIIAGGANNQLEDEELHSVLLADRNTVYAPAILINDAGLVKCDPEVVHYYRDGAYRKTERICDVMPYGQKPAQTVAREMAQSSIDFIARIQSKY